VVVEVAIKTLLQVREGLVVLVAAVVVDTADLVDQPQHLLLDRVMLVGTVLDQGQITVAVVAVEQRTQRQLGRVVTAQALLEAMEALDLPLVRH
jgi:hypothetical protein